MAQFFWVPKFGSWSGSTANLGTEDAPFIGSDVLDAAFGGIISSAGGHIITFMGEYGVVGLAELTMAYWANDNKTITQPLNYPAGSILKTATNRQGGIVLGSSYTGSSNCKNNTFRFRGPNTYHIDGRGATTNAQRMRACMTIQGVNNRAEGIRVANPNWDYIDSGSGARIPASTITSGASNVTAHECSDENFGLVMFGGWGCQIDRAQDDSRCVGFGGNAFGRSSFVIYLGMLDTASQAGNPFTYIRGTYSFGASDGPQIVNAGGLVNGGLAFPERITPAAGARCELYDNEVGDLRWGDSAATPAINNAMVHGNHLNIKGNLWVRGSARVRGNNTYGNCQDSIEVLGANVHVFENWVHDICPTFTGVPTVGYWYNNAGVWATSTTAGIGEGIKLGLGSEGWGSVPSLTWPHMGVLVGGLNMAGGRNQAYRNFVEKIAPTNSGAITTNGGNGSVIHANEINDTDVGVKISRTGMGGTDVQAAWVSNNAAFCRGIAAQGNNNTVVRWYNNIFRGGGGAGQDFSYAGATAGTIIGANNRFVNNQTNFGTGLTNLLTGSTSGAAGYTLRSGPTPGGNCAASGSWEGLMRAYTACVERDMRNRRWNGALPNGPYR